MDTFKPRVVTIPVKAPDIDKPAYFNVALFIFLKYNVQLYKMIGIFSLFLAILGHESKRVETLNMLTLQVAYIISLIVS